MVDVREEWMLSIWKHNGTLWLHWSWIKVLGNIATLNKKLHIFSSSAFFSFFLFLSVFIIYQPFLSLCTHLYISSHIFLYLILFHLFFYLLSSLLTVFLFHLQFLFCSVFHFPLFHFVCHFSLFLFPFMFLFLYISSHSTVTFSFFFWFMFSLSSLELFIHMFYIVFHFLFYNHFPPYFSFLITNFSITFISCYYYPYLLCSYCWIFTVNICIHFTLFLDHLLCTDL